MSDLKRDIRKLINSECATFDTSTDNKCLLETGAGRRTCVYFRDDIDGLPRCPWFENMVLPGDSDLHARYWQAFGAMDWQGDTCERCRKQYKRKSNRQRYCPECAEIMTKERRRARDRKYHERMRQQIDGLDA